MIRYYFALKSYWSKIHGIAPRYPNMPKCGSKVTHQRYR